MRIFDKKFKDKSYSFNSCSINDVNGSVTVNGVTYQRGGNVTGDIDTTGAVTVDGDLTGDIDTAGRVTIGGIKR